MNGREQLPKKVQMLELLLRDGIQHLPTVLPTETKVWFAEQFIQAGYTLLEVTNFGHPRLLPQAKDAETILEKFWQIEAVKKGDVTLKSYGMTRKAFERAAASAQKGYPSHVVAFTISADDLHGRRNSNRTREEYLKEIPSFVEIARANNFVVDMAIACAYGSPCTGPTPIENTIELIERGLDLGIRNFTPCDTTGECNPRRAFEYMSALLDRFGAFQHEVKFRVAHFHEARGMAMANTLAAIAAGARIVETSLGLLGGQPGFIVGGVPGIGTGPLYTNSSEVGNCSTEDTLVALDEMGIDVGVDIDKMLQLGRVLEWVLGRTLRPWTTKAGRPVKYPVEWNIAEQNLAYVPPYGSPEMFWADPSRYIPASDAYIAKQFEGRKLRRDPQEVKLEKTASQQPTD